MLQYTLLRGALFAGSFLVIWGLVYVRALPAGLGDSNLLWVMLLALALSAPLSFVLLRGARERASVQISARVDRARLRAAEEDEADEAARGANPAA
jgi:hypothetical protein